MSFRRRSGSSRRGRNHRSQIQDQVRTALFGQVTNTVASGERLINIHVRLADAFGVISIG